MAPICKWIKTKNEFMGYHQYKGAPQDVSFLAAWHRHNFIVTTSLTVNHNERDIEFFELQHLIKTWVEATHSSLKVEGTKGYLEGITIQSCETLAEELAMMLFDKFHKERSIRVEVSEDNESSSIIEVYKAE